MIFDRFDRIAVINLPHRLDRRREMTRELGKVGLASSQKVEFLAAPPPADEGRFYSRGAHGCFLSHRLAISKAAAAGQSLLILEDDADFTTLAATYDPTYFDFLWGGVLEASNPADLQASDIIGAHCIGLTAPTVQKLDAYLDRYFDDDFVVDAKAMDGDYDPEKRAPIDGAYVWFRRAHPEVVTVFAELATQRPSRTDVGTPKWFDRVPVLRGLANALRRVR